jgi:hypothetical protein
MQHEEGSYGAVQYVLRRIPAIPIELNQLECKSKISRI